MANVLLVNANSLTIPLDDCSVQMVATSPPYYGLRDYGIANQIGLEQSPEEYVANLVAVFREVRRVLRDDGVCFLNLGDSYATSPAGNKIPSGFSQTGGKREGKLQEYNTQSKGFGDCKPKDLIGIPWMVAFALRDDGWWLRNSIPWIKRNSMPESAEDRATCTTEQIFMLTKSKTYYYDNEAVKMPAAYPDDLRRPIGSQGAWELDGRKRGENGGGQPYEHDATTRNRRVADWFMESWEGLLTDDEGNPLASIVNTSGFKGAHFATWPPKLVEPMVKAGSKVGDIVLDPFAGSGTTLVVARQLGRSAIGLDLSFAYLQEQARKRLELDKWDRWIAH